MENNVVSIITRRPVDEMDFVAQEYADSHKPFDLYDTENAKLHPDLYYPLSPYEKQWDAIEFIRRVKRGLIRDKVGTGKTLEGAYAAVGKTLVVCPNYLTEQWFNWLNGIPEDTDGVEKPHPPYAPYGRQHIVWAKGSFNERLIALQSEADYIVVNQEMLQTHNTWFKEFAKESRWQTIIIDEAHNFRNFDTKRSYTAVELAISCEYIITLTATPIWKEVDNLYMQFRLLQPGMFTSYYDFVDTYCIADSDRYGTKVLGAKKDMIQPLQDILELVSIGRTYEDMGRDLPPMIEHHNRVEFPPHIRKAYDDMLAEMSIKYGMDSEDEDGEIKFEFWVQVMRTMRMMTAFPGKYDMAKNIMEDFQDPKDPKKVVVFCWYRETAEEAARVLGGVAIHGGLPVQERRRLALSSQVVCATISALSNGIDLSEARLLMFLEQDYTPGSMEQAIGRVQRERHTEDNVEPIMLHYVYVKDTIDETIYRTALRRGGTLKEVLKKAIKKEHTPYEASSSDIDEIDDDDSCARCGLPRFDHNEFFWPTEPNIKPHEFEKE